MDKTTCIIQARMGSTRLPGKVLAPICGQPLLGVMLDRLEDLAVDNLVVATTALPADDPITDYCDDRGIAVVRGSEPDVLGRFVAALERFPAADVIRLTADCPLADPAVIAQVVARHLRHDVDYTSNTLVRTFPDGLDVEVISAEALRGAHGAAQAPEEREHVTPYIYRHPERFRLAAVRSHEMAGDERWTVDTAADLEFVRHLVEAAGGWAAVGWVELLNLAGRRSRRAAGELHLRPPGAGDCELLRTWRNDPDAVRFSRSGRTVTAAEHMEWFGGVLDNPATRVWIGDVDGVPVGVVRIEVVAARAEIGVAVDRVARGRGYGSRLIGGLVKVLGDDYQVKTLRATINEANTASLRAFSANGFSRVGSAGDFAILQRQR